MSFVPEFSPLSSHTAATYFPFYAVACYSDADKSISLLLTGFHRGCVVPVFALLLSSDFREINMHMYPLHKDLTDLS